MTTHTRPEGTHHVVALHGWFGWSDGWGADFRPLLERSLGEEVEVHWFDYRGYGDRLDEAGKHTLDEIAGDVLALMDQRGVGAFSLIGHSMGGAAALRTAARAPERIRSLVGVSPVGASPTPFDEQSHDLFYGAAEDDTKRHGIIDFTTGNRHLATWVDHLVADSRTHSTVASFAEHLVAWAEADFADEVPDTIPTLVVVGAHDPALGEATIRQTWCAVLPDAEVVVLAESGHYPMLEQPVGLVDALVPFLSSH